MIRNSDFALPNIAPEFITQALRTCDGGTVMALGGQSANHNLAWTKRSEITIALCEVWKHCGGNTARIV